MQQLNLSKEMVGFLADFAQQINTQDNRATNSPYYYQVHSTKDLPAPVGYTDKKGYFVPLDCERWNEADLRDWCKKEGHDFDEFVEENCEEYTLQEITEYNNIFFTEKGYDEHMKLNGHNYRNYKATTSYIKYANRNPEIEMLLKTVLEIAKQLNVNLCNTCSFGSSCKPELANRVVSGENTIHCKGYDGGDDEIFGRGS